MFTYAYICLTQKKSFVGSDVTHKGQTFSTQGAIVRKDEDDGRWAPWGFHQWGIPSGKRTKNPWKITIFNGKIKYFDWAIFNSYVSLPEGTPKAVWLFSSWKILFYHV